MKEHGKLFLDIKIEIVVVVWGVVVGGVSAVSDGVVKLDVGLVPVTVLLLGVGVGCFLG